ncbi:S26 family signal peptidase [Candidatus Curtissbacteria bacterium]|nr:S26 family signal peptidase [Candidatus Curtissbacteria bacterium]
MKFKPPFSYFVVEEESMMPTYKPGDRLFTFNWSNIHEGSPIVFKEKGTCYVKRVTKVEDETIFVRGDNKHKSAVMAPIKRAQVIGRVLWAGR